MYFQHEKCIQVYLCLCVLSYAKVSYIKHNYIQKFTLITYLNNTILVFHIFIFSWFSYLVSFGHKFAQVFFTFPHLVFILLGICCHHLYFKFFFCVSIAIQMLIVFFLLAAFLCCSFCVERPFLWFVFISDWFFCRGGFLKLAPSLPSYRKCTFHSTEAMCLSPFKHICVNESVFLGSILWYLSI